jgi:branched-chain amino acid transport system ATP-binding protein
MDAALALIRGIAARGITVILIEHLMKVVLSLCTRIVVLHHGELIASGTPAEVVKDARVVQAYLGRRYGAAQAVHG